MFTSIIVLSVFQKQVNSDHSKHRLQNRPASVSSSRIPSPPQPGPSPVGSPVFQQRSPSSPDSQTASLYQHLQRLHLHQTNPTSPNFRRGSPPNLVQVYSAQRSESPPQTYQTLLQNYQASHQRSSPPPNFQNLQMIKEDSLDMQEKSSQSDSDEDMATQDNTAASNSKQSPTSAKTYAGKPQISITDTQGHVTAVTSDGDSESEKGDADSSAGTPILPSVTTSAPPPFTYSFTLPYSTYINTNLTNIPATDPVTVAQNQQNFTQYDPSFANISWNNPQLAYLQRLQGVTAADLAKYRTLNSIGQYANTQTGCDPYNMGIKGLYNNYRDNRSYAGSDYMFQRSAQSSNPTHCGFQTHSTPMLGVDGMSDLRKAGSFVNVSSKRSVTDILNEIKKILDDSVPNIMYTCCDNGFMLENSDVAMEVEVMEGIDMTKLQVRRISGDRIHYQQLCQELLEGINI